MNVSLRGGVREGESGVGKSSVLGSDISILEIIHIGEAASLSSESQTSLQLSDFVGARGAQSLGGGGGAEHAAHIVEFDVVVVSSAASDQAGSIKLELSGWFGDGRDNGSFSGGLRVRAVAEALVSVSVSVFNLNVSSGERASVGEAGNPAERNGEDFLADNFISGVHHLESALVQAKAGDGDLDNVSGGGSNWWVHLQNFW